ncbi:Ninja-family protein like [Actinidia chinensis var. chinensis]|uniref:Ninja-family protein n=1 Tax=Actinidia chinensis var. chinensis TaxID=1590841 RepID=A0A2R6PRS8_ACTCC|nr:Ninja-family protein like [Actinidia chinensis var. chinensis]
MGEANCKNGIARNNNSDSYQLDLNLGLSLGGSYTQFPQQSPLIRTSSLNWSECEGSGFLSLARSSSLPTEAEQEMRRVKEMQAMKRMEAKKRILEKQRSRGGFGGGGEEEVKFPAAAARVPAKANSSIWVVESATKNTAFCRAIEKLKSNVGPSGTHMIKGPESMSATKIPAVSQPPVNSIAMENGKSAYPANHRSLEKLGTGKPVNPNHTIYFGKRENGKSVEPAETEPPTKRVEFSANRTYDPKMMEILRLMPSVTTTGNGPNGRRIEGFLYRYRNRTRQVCIVCICHGSFLSPAEFIRHAGGGDLAEPMKHITVLPGVF